MRDLVKYLLSNRHHSGASCPHRGADEPGPCPQSQREQGQQGELEPLLVGNKSMFLPSLPCQHCGYCLFDALSIMFMKLALLLVVLALLALSVLNLWIALRSRGAPPGLKNCE